MITRLLSCSASARGQLNKGFEGEAFLFLVQECVATPAFAKILPVPKLALSSRVFACCFLCENFECVESTPHLNIWQNCSPDGEVCGDHQVDQKETVLLLNLQMAAWEGGCFSPTKILSIKKRTQVKIFYVNREIEKHNTHQSNHVYLLNVFNSIYNTILKETPL